MLFRIESGISGSVFEERLLATDVLRAEVTVNSLLILESGVQIGTVVLLEVQVFLTVVSWGVCLGWESSFGHFSVRRLVGY